MNKLIGLAFSDLHIHKFTEYGSKKTRLQWSLSCLKYIGGVANKKKVPVFFSGDLFHNPKEVENEVGSNTIKSMYEVYEKFKVPFYAISGNHDLSQRNGLDNRSPSHLQKFEHLNCFTLLDWLSPMRIDSSFSTPITIKGIPYMDNDEDVYKVIKLVSKEVQGISGFKILMLHQDLPGAVSPAGFECKEYHALGKVKYKKLFKDWDLVLCGHIHKPQKLYKNVYMLGSPIHQIKSDEGTEMGYWEIYYKSEPKFIPLNSKYPQFITLEKDQTPYNEWDHFIKQPAELLVEDTTEIKEFSIKKSRSKLAKVYCNRKKIKSKSKITALKKILSEV